MTNNLVVKVKFDKQAQLVWKFQTRVDGNVYGIVEKDGKAIPVQVNDFSGCPVATIPDFVSNFAETV